MLFRLCIVTVLIHLLYGLSVVSIHHFLCPFVAPAVVFFCLLTIAIFSVNVELNPAFYQVILTANV